MAHRIVILGAGTGGTLTANRLRRVYSPEEAQITVVDQDDRHVYQPGLLFVPFGLTHPEDIVRPRGRQLHRGIDYHRSAVGSVDIAGNHVTLEDGETLDYDVLVVATGAALAPEETEGLTGPGWMERVFTFYTPEGALPGVSGVMTRYMNHKIEELDIPSIPEFIEMIADTGAGLYACKASVDLFGLEKNDFIPQIQDIITVGEFYEIAAGGQIIFT